MATSSSSSSSSSSSPQSIRKRDGQVVCYDAKKIHTAVGKALCAVGRYDTVILKSITGEVEQNLTDDVPTVEDIQNMVEKTLIEQGYAETAKAYILYRNERTKIRDEKKKVLECDVLDDVSKKLSLNSVRVLASRYLTRDQNNRIIETPSEMFGRVAATAVLAEILYSDYIFSRDGRQMIHDNDDDDDDDDDDDQTYTDEEMSKMEIKIGNYTVNRWHIRAMQNHYLRLNAQGKMKKSFKEICKMFSEDSLGDEYVPRFERFYSLMVDGVFLPNSPTLMNAGCRLGQLSACFVLGMDDSIESIMDTAKDAASIFRSGGGVGINYSSLRDSTSMVTSTSGMASGPVPFMDIINTVTEVVKQGGKRRGANMGIIESWHPDIEAFIRVKNTPGVLENFNISVGTWSDFWDAVRSGGKQVLKTPYGAKKGEIDANQLLDTIAMSAWGSAEPGLLFLHRANKYNVLQYVRDEPLRTTNPCGEQFLYPNESCNLGSINVGEFVDADGDFDWDRYTYVIADCTAFLDAMVDANSYPTPATQIASIETRRIGLGLMGMADCLAMMDTRYDSEDGYSMLSKLCEYLTFHSMTQSVTLAKSRGRFALCDSSKYADGALPIAGIYEGRTHSCDWQMLALKIKEFGIRNVLTTTIAPTGTIAMIAGCSNGIEPFYSLAYRKDVSVGSFGYVNEILSRKLKAAGLDADAIIDGIRADGGTLRDSRVVPQPIKDAFRTAMDIHWADHVMAQAVCQDWIGNSISKTINMPASTRMQDVKSAYVLAHSMGLKGITVYRDGSRDTQVLSSGGSAKKSPVRPTQVCTVMANERLAPEDRPFVDSIFRDNSNRCNDCGGVMVCNGGCHTCPDCGTSSCSSA